jgi:hypothetical protein
MAVASSGVMRPSTAPRWRCLEGFLTFARYSMRSQGSDTSLGQCARMNPEQARAARDSVEVVHVVINHLRLREPVPNATVEAARKGMRLVVDAGALAARVAKVDETHLILILEFSTAEDADRIAREVGGPWMRENIRPLLAGDTERSVAEVIASATA